MESKIKMLISYEQALEIARHTDVADFEAYLINEHKIPLNGENQSYYLDPKGVDFWFIDQLINLIKECPIYQDRLPLIEEVLSTFLATKAFVHIPNNQDYKHA